MAEDSTSPDREGSGWLATLARHPVISGFIISCMLGGVVLGLLYLPPDWSLMRRVLGGLVGGAGVGVFVTSHRMIG